jgi:hypothetical protein
VPTTKKKTRAKDAGSRLNPDFFGNFFLVGVNSKVLPFRFALSLGLTNHFSRTIKFVLV